MKNLNIFDYLRPNMIMRITSIFSPWFLYVSLCLLFSSFLLVVFTVEPDYQQGENYRILYIHVPFAWMSLLLYIFLTLCSIFYLITLSPSIYFVSKSIAVVGCVFTFLTLITGSFWGYPMWGTFWVWDARLTSVLILFFVYLGYLYLSSFSIKDFTKNSYISSIFSIFGVILLPIIKYSVEWWNTLHQGSSISQFNSDIHLSMVLPLLLSFSGFLFYSFYLIVLLLRNYFIFIKLYKF